MIYGPYVTMDGFPVERTKTKYPYSYDAFRVYRRHWSPNDKCVYSDRMFEWDSEKFNECCKEVFGNSGQLFGNRKPDGIQKFLRLYFEDDDIFLTGIMEGCNMSNGYPYWIFYYTSKESLSRLKQALK